MIPHAPTPGPHPDLAAPSGQTVRRLTLAIPTDNGRLHGHFGGSRQFTLVEVDPESRSILRTELLPAPNHQPGVFPRWLGQHGVDHVIAEGIGHRALDLLGRQGITVRAGIPGARVEELVAAFLDGGLQAPPSGCHHHGHDHGHHEHGHHEHGHHDHGHHEHGPDVRGHAQAPAGSHHPSP